ncbi:MAG: hypothetical protein R2733_07140 [Acidimicrobiales bacterium]
MELASQTSSASAPDSRKRQIPRVRTPLWRRLTALISLGSLVVIIGVILAVALGLAFLLTLLLLERAAG